MKTRPCVINLIKKYILRCNFSSLHPYKQRLTKNILRRAWLIHETIFCFSLRLSTSKKKMYLKRSTKKRTAYNVFVFIFILFCTKKLRISFRRNVCVSLSNKKQKKKVMQKDRTNKRQARIHIKHMCCERTRSRM